LKGKQGRSNNQRKEMLRNRMLCWVIPRCRKETALKLKERRLNRKSSERRTSVGKPSKRF